MLWIFGYGSLVWRPAFAHALRTPAYLEGYARRFWQGSIDHRGLPERPGRVVTLVADSHPSLEHDSIHRPEPCWGTAYAVPRADPEGVIEALDHRERGGYDRVEVELMLGPTRAGAKRSAVQGFVYIARPENENYLGPAPLENIARQIAGAQGPSGPNPEYVFELARALREMGVVDRHVFDLERAVEETIRSVLVGRDGKGGGSRLRPGREQDPFA